MIHFVLAALLSTIAQVPQTQPAVSRPADLGDRLGLMTFNIRLGTVDDGPNHWKLRREMVFGVIREHGPDLVGMQEVVRFQLDELLAALPNYEGFGAGREDGQTKGEYSPILYRKDRLKLLESGTFWLSETPEVPGSKSWDTACTRVCTWGRFRENRTGRTLYFFNTHLDHKSQPAREKGIALVLQRIEERPHKDPVFLTGDFNAGENNAAIKLVKKFKHLRDSYRVAHPDEKEVGTFNGWKGKSDGDKIDYIFVPRGVNVVSAEILHENRDGRYPSDHFPLMTIVE